MTEALSGMDSVRRINTDADQTKYVFEVKRGSRGPLYILWERRDLFAGKDLPGTPFEYECHARHVKAVDVLGQTVAVTLKSNRAKLLLGAKPVFIDSE
jgi:hypothetical protein